MLRHRNDPLEQPKTPPNIRTILLGTLSVHLFVMVASKIVSAAWQRELDLQAQRRLAALYAGLSETYQNMNVSSSHNS